MYEFTDKDYNKWRDLNQRGFSLIYIAEKFGLDLDFVAEKIEEASKHEIIDADAEMFPDYSWEIKASEAQKKSFMKSKRERENRQNIQLERIREGIKNKLNYTEIGRGLGVSRSTIVKALRNAQKIRVN